MKIIVTGGAGFIGSNLVDFLVKKKHKVIVIDNFSTGLKNNLKLSQNKVKIINKDISSNNNLDRIFKGADYVFHLAGLADIVPSIERPESYFKSNVLGTFNILEACRKNKIKKIIYAASASCYGLPKRFPTNELEKINVKYPYAFTKWQGEELVKHWFEIYKLPYISMRFFNVYGPRSRTSGAYGAVFGVFLAQKVAKRPLTVVGSGKQTRDFIHITDIVEALYKAAFSKVKGKIYNVGSGKETSVNKIANLISKKRISIPKRPGEPDRSLSDIKKIQKDLNWRPKVNIEKGVQDLLENLHHWKKAPVWTPKKIKKATKVWFKFLKKK
tara:strand:- start:498 stop:1481 length:984 start_codon:yes stop_codon:yes gene_type:complete